MNPSPSLSTIYSRFLRPLSLAGALLLLGACAEVENLRIIKDAQDTYIDELKMMLEQDRVAHNQARKQMKNQLDAKDELLDATRDNLLKAETQRTERERALEREGANLQRRLSASTLDLDYQKQLAQQRLGQIEEGTAANAALQQSVREKDDSIADFKSQVATAKKGEMDLNTQNENLKDDLEKARKDLEQVAVLETKMGEKEKTIARYEEDMGKLGANLERLQAAINEKNTAAGAVAEDNETLKKRADELDRQLKAIQNGKVILDADFRDAQNLFQLSLKPLGDAVGIYSDSRGLVVALKVTYLFPDKKVELDPQILSTLNRIAEILKKYPSKFVEVQGHTDPSPITSMTYADNWALGWARADLVTRYLVDHAKLSAKRVKSASCSQFRPPKDDSIKTDKQMLRRVEIIMSAHP